MLLNEESLVLYHNVSIPNYDIKIFLSYEDGLCLHFNHLGRDVFHSLETITPEDNLSLGVFPTIKYLDVQCESVIKRFTGESVSLEGVAESLNFYLLSYSRIQLEKELTTKKE